LYVNNFGGTELKGNAADEWCVLPIMNGVFCAVGAEKLKAGRFVGQNFCSEEADLLNGVQKFVIQRVFVREKQLCWG
jgi:hypothetical protein